MSASSDGLRKNQRAKTTALQVFNKLYFCKNKRKTKTNTLTG